MALVWCFIPLLLLVCLCDFVFETYAENDTNIVSLYQSICGNTCGNRITNEIQMLNPTNGALCSPCTPCSCEDTCQMFGTCCPDLEKETLYDTLCMAVRLSRNSGDSQQILTSVVTGCPTTNMSAYADACLTGTFNNDYDPRLALAATESGLDLLFYNKYCALCNGFNVSTVLQSELHCMEGSKPPALASNKDLFLWASSASDCKIVYSSSKENLRLPTCSVITEVLVSKCNTTGLWERYDSELEEACHLYNNPMTQEFRPRYKNIFCYLCNGENTSKLLEHKCFDVLLHLDTKHLPFKSISFVAILNFLPPTFSYARASDPQELTPICDPSSVYDQLEDKCKTLLCEDYEMLVDGSCQFQFLILQHAVFHINVLFIPNTTISLNGDGKVEEFSRRVFDKLHFFLSPKLMEVNMSLDGINTLIRPVNQRNGYLEVEGAFLDLYVKPMEITSIGVAEAVLVNDKLYQLEIEHGNSVIFFQPSIIYGGEELDVSDGSYPSFWGVSINGDNRGSEFLIQLNPSTNCPLIEYEQKVFQILSNWQIRLQHENINITFNRTQYMVNDSKILLCSWYLEDIPSFRTLEGQQILNYHHEDTDDSDGSATATSVVQFIGLVCLFLTFLTHSIFRELRTLAGKNLMLLVLSLFVAHLAFMGGAYALGRPRACRVIGVIIHFSWLSAFAWMAVCSFHVYRAFRTVTPSGYTQGDVSCLCKYCLFAFGVPFLIVFLVCVFNLGMSNGEDFGYGSGKDHQICFLSSMLVSALTFALPVTINIIHNFLFLVSACISLRKASRVRRSLRQKDMNILAQCCKLSTLTGVSWVVGFVATLTKLKVFVYMFVLLSAGQGVFLFFAFVTTRRVLKMYRDLFRRICFGNKDSGNKNRHTMTLKTLA